LLEQDGIAAAAAVLRLDAPGQPRLVGYVVPAEGHTLDPVALRARLAAVLPDAMVPSPIVALGALPRSPNGKLDRAALPAPEASDLTEYLAPRTPLEARLAQIWADVLGVPRVGIADNFFELGGHSLLITRVAARIRHELGFDLPLRALFDGQTVAAIAALIEHSRPHATGDELAAMSDLLDELEQT
jgi:acyl carrier protein